MSSWILRTLLSYGKEALAENQISITEVPTIRVIQQTLVDINDKPADFINSTEWIGALEVCNIFLLSNETIIKITLMYAIL